MQKKVRIFSDKMSMCLEHAVLNEDKRILALFKIGHCPFFVTNMKLLYKEML